MRGLVVMLLLLVAAGPLEAQRSLAIRRFDADIAVQKDGSIIVAESITAQFTGAWNGIYRTVPVDYHTPQDRPERINYVKMEKVARLVYQTSWDLANAASRPKLLPR